MAREIFKTYPFLCTIFTLTFLNIAIRNDLTFIQHVEKKENKAGHGELVPCTQKSLQVPKQQSIQTHCGQKSWPCL